MNTREEIINLLSQSKKPLGAKRISSELKKTSVNIRKILSNLFKEGKIVRAGYGKYILSVNVKNKSVNVGDLEVKRLSNKEYYQRLKLNDPELYEKIRLAKHKYYIRWKEKNPDYNKNWLKAYYKKHPEKHKEYRRRYWLKKALPPEGS